MRATATRHGGRLLVVTLAVTVALEVLLTRPTLSARFDFTPVSASEASSRLDHATVEVLSLGCDLSLRQGTAVALAGNRLVTAVHVVGSSRALYLVADMRPPVMPSRVAFSATADLAVLNSARVDTSPLALAPYDPQPGDHVRFAGYPHDPELGATVLPDGLAIDEAIVRDYESGSAAGQPGLMMRLSALAQEGMSGGPVLDQSGRLAGVVFAVQSPTNLTLAIPASVLRQLLRAPTTAAPRC